MARTKISEFSATPANNTDIDSINIAEGCAPSGINDAIRELMAQLKDFQTGAVGDSFNGPIGTTTAAAGAFTTLSSTGNTTLGDASGDAITVNGTATFANANPTLTAGTANGVTYLNGSKVLTSGSALTFDGSNLGIGVASSSQTLYINKAVSGNYGAIALIGNSAGAAADRSGIYGTYNGDYRGGITFWPGANGAVSIHTGNNAAPTTGQTAFFASDLTAQFAASISVGNATPSASGVGITFPATQSASSNANTLDDYEEGTWTPTDGSGASLSFTSVTATYTKVGRLVTITCQLTYPVTSSTSDARISGLPFTASVDSGFAIGYDHKAAIRNAYVNSTSIDPYATGFTRNTNVSLSQELSLTLSGSYIV
jgi:hypothetical protein